VKERRVREGKSKIERYGSKEREGRRGERKVTRSIGKG
jgi:hypothetical protein